jgi:outer membrane biosynthesis protein TonB
VKYSDITYIEVVKAYTTFNDSRTNYENTYRNSSKRRKRNADKVTIARDGSSSSTRLSSSDEDRVFDRAYKRIKVRVWSDLATSARVRVRIISRFLPLT